MLSVGIYLILNEYDVMGNVDDMFENSVVGGYNDFKSDI